VRASRHRCTLFLVSEDRQKLTAKFTSGFVYEMPIVPALYVCMSGVRCFCMPGTRCRSYPAFAATLPPRARL
jgi:hypothetical protein